MQVIGANRRCLQAADWVLLLLLRAQKFEQAVSQCPPLNGGTQ
jgi:hypothetical protein